MIYNFNCKLKNNTFKYKVEAENITQAKIKVREHIKNAVVIEEVKPILNDDLNIFGDNDIFERFNNIFNKK